jgi:hypothetical protein
MAVKRYNEILTSLRSVQEPDADGKNQTFSLVYYGWGSAGFVWTSSSNIRVPKILQDYLFKKYNPNVGMISGKFRKDGEYSLEDISEISGIDLKRIRFVFGNGEKNPILIKKNIISILENRWRDLEDWLVNPDPQNVPVFRQTEIGKYSFRTGRPYNLKRKCKKYPNKIQRNGIVYYSMMSIMKKIHKDEILKQPRLGKFRKAVMGVIKNLKGVIKESGSYYLTEDIRESVRGLASDREEVDGLLEGVTIKDVANGLDIFEEDVKDLIKNGELKSSFSGNGGLVTLKSFEVLKLNWNRKRAQEYSEKTLEKRISQVEKRH